MGGALSPVTDSDLPVCRDVERVDGYFLWVPDNGDPVVFSAVNDAGDIDPLDYFDAEASPDVNLGVINFRNDLLCSARRRSSDSATWARKPPRLSAWPAA